MSALMAIFIGSVPVVVRGLQEMYRVRFTYSKAKAQITRKVLGVEAVPTLLGKLSKTYVPDLGLQTNHAGNEVRNPGQ